jgi:hypothetical protein
MPATSGDRVFSLPHWRSRPHEGGILKRPHTPESKNLLLARFLADLLDQRFTIPGTSIRIGLDPLLGLIPGIGDLLANVAGSAILIIAARYKVPKIILLRMALNVAANAMIGAIPVFGDIFSIWFRSNVRNARLLERSVGAKPAVSTPADWIFVAVVVLGLILLLVGIFAAIVWVVGQA